MRMDNVRDITANSFEAWRGRQSKDKMLPKTLNGPHACSLRFLQMVERRTGDNPMRMVVRIKAMGDPSRKRRAFAPEELWRLINVSGERGILYLVAASTGFRRGELEQIEWRDVCIDLPKPYINVRSLFRKNSKTVQQPLPPNVTAALRQWRGRDLAPTAFVFKRLMPEMDRFRGDLRAAGIPYVDGKGKVADFHSLRKTLGTELGKAGVPIRVAMELMRHSDVKLTTKIYTDSGMLPISGCSRLAANVQRHTNRHTKSSREQSKGVWCCPIERAGCPVVRPWK